MNGIEGIVRAYYKDMLFSEELHSKSTISIGSDCKDTMNFEAEGLMKSHFTIKALKQGIYFFCKGKGMYRNKKCRMGKFVDGSNVILNVQPNITVSLHPKQSDRDELLDITDLGTIQVGRAEENTIILRNKRTSSKHFSIYRENTAYMIKDLGSTNGTFINGKLITNTELKDGDIINFSVYEFIFVQNTKGIFLKCNNIGTDMKVNTEIYDTENTCMIDYQSEKTSILTDNIIDNYSIQEEK